MSATVCELQHKTHLRPLLLKLAHRSRDWRNHPAQAAQIALVLADCRAPMLLSNLFVIACASLLPRTCCTAVDQS